MGEARGKRRAAFRFGPRSGSFVGFSVNEGLDALIGGGEEGVCHHLCPGKGIGLGQGLAELGLEGAFDIEFPDHMLSRSVFATIASMAAAIRQLLG